MLVVSKLFIPYLRNFQKGFIWKRAFSYYTENENYLLVMPVPINLPGMKVCNQN
jgi:hypothetical protein